MLAGVRYIADHDLLVVLLVLALLPIMLGVPFQIMLPVFADDVYDVGSVGLGVMMSVAGFGAAIGSILIGSLGDFPKRGTMQLAAGILFGIGLVLFGLAGKFARTPRSASCGWPTIGTSSGWTSRPNVSRR